MLAPVGVFRDLYKVTRNQRLLENEFVDKMLRYIGLVK